jgi:hypothetical protein
VKPSAETSPKLVELDRGAVVDTDAKLRNVAWIAAQLTEASFDLRAMRTRDYQHAKRDLLTTEALLAVR